MKTSWHQPGLSQHCQKERYVCTDPSCGAAHIVGPEAAQNSKIISCVWSRDRASMVFKLAENMINNQTILKSPTADYFLTFDINSSINAHFYYFKIGNTGFNALHSLSFTNVLD